jgi:hypothetical protein
MTPTLRAIDWCRRTREQDAHAAGLHAAGVCCAECVDVETAIAEAVAAATERAAGLVAERREKVLANPRDPSWTEHFADLVVAIRAASPP